MTKVHRGSALIHGGVLMEYGTRDCMYKSKTERNEAVGEVGTYFSGEREMLGKSEFNKRLCHTERGCSDVPVTCDKRFSSWPV